jgi:hypothetical protein
MSGLRRFSILLAAISITVLEPAPARAAREGDPAAAVLRGRVEDGRGAGLTGVRLRLVSPSRGVACEAVVTDPNGAYRFDDLPPAPDYHLRAELEGRLPIELGPLALRPGRATNQTVTLRTAEEVGPGVVPAARPGILAQDLSGGFDAEMIRRLPLVGRR